ncbi:MAG: hypothetical protein NVS4B9_01430 [Ktedonobacteraceae bacterium]
MQFLRSRQQLTTCPQCDNVVPIDAEFCNICGQQLKGLDLTDSMETDLSDEDEEYEEEYREEGFDAAHGKSLSNMKSTHTATIPSALNEILHQLQSLQDQAQYIERYFPTELPGKVQKLALWKRQLQRAYACAKLFERPQLLQIESQQALKMRRVLGEAARALDFTREYTVKVIGHAGAGKSTLLAAMIGQDIFPRLAGGAVTGVRTRIRLCSEQAPEELRVHFLTRNAFADLLQQTQNAIQHTSSQRLRDALNAELAIMLKASEAFADRYLRDDSPYVEVIAREQWKAESSRYIEEPPRDSQEPDLLRMIDYVEYTIHAGSQALLPPGSVFVDLPGGAAGQLRHDAILRAELDEVDAVILVIGNNRFGDDDRTQRIFELVRHKVTQHHTADVAAHMLFLAVTHWDEINSEASLEKAFGSLRPLLRDLPANYSSYHHHGPNNDYFFYPLRGVDALLATLGINKQKLDADRAQEGCDYAGRILSIYPELLKIDATLPATANAKEFQKMSLKRHEAMLRLSGLPQLTHDMQVFLASNRYELQLRQAETQVAMALQQLEDLCWEHLNGQGIQSHDFQELQLEMQTRKQKRGAARFEQLQKRTNEMHAAWNEALKDFDAVISIDDNPFHRVLETAHDRALRRIKLRIMQGHFDSFIKVSNRIQSDSPAMDIGTRWVDIDGWGLIKDLRIKFSAALEREVNEPARTLAEAFLIPITHQEEIDGTLNISRVALGESGGELDEIQKLYNKLKRTIREKARDVCLYVTMGELLNEEKYAPTKDEPAVSALYRLVSAPGKPEDLIQQARQLMGPILDVICGQLAESTERRIVHLFRYELDKLEERQVYDSDRLDTLPVTIPGAFADLVNRLYSLLTERILISESLRQQLDTLQAQREAIVDGWVELLQDTEALRTLQWQN